MVDWSVANFFFATSLRRSKGRAEVVFTESVRSSLQLTAYLGFCSQRSGHLLPSFSFKKPSFELLKKVIQIKLKYALSLIFVCKKSILINAVLGGKVAVSCNSQSALARLNSFSEVEYMQGLVFARDGDVWVLRNGYS